MPIQNQADRFVRKRWKNRRGEQPKAHLIKFHPTVLRAFYATHPTTHRTLRLDGRTGTNTKNSQLHHRAFSSSRIRNCIRQILNGDRRPQDQFN